MLPGGGRIKVGQYRGQVCALARLRKTLGQPCELHLRRGQYHGVGSPFVDNKADPNRGARVDHVDHLRQSGRADAAAEVAPDRPAGPGARPTRLPPLSTPRSALHTSLNTSEPPVKAEADPPREPLQVTTSRSCCVQ
jgi:hypothetical protein